MPSRFQFPSRIIWYLPAGMKAESFSGAAAVITGGTAISFISNPDTRVFLPFIIKMYRQLLKTPFGGAHRLFEEKLTVRRWKRSFPGINAELLCG